MADQVVAQQHGRLVAAEVVDRRALAAKLGLVEHVVVHERGHVDHLDDGGEHVCGSVIPPQALPLSSSSVGRSILPRKRLTCLTSVLTHGRSLRSSSWNSCSTAASSVPMQSVSSASTVASPSQPRRRPRFPALGFVVVPGKVGGL